MSLMLALTTAALAGEPAVVLHNGGLVEAVDQGEWSLLFGRQGQHVDLSLQQHIVGSDDHPRLGFGGHDNDLVAQPDQGCRKVARVFIAARATELVTV